MQEIGSWTTAEGSTEATLAYESELPGEDSGQELPKWLTGALSGAAAGAATGAAAGPYGALIGAATGAAIGGSTAATAPPPKKSPPAKSASTPPAAASSDASRANVVRALQQFAAAVPTLIQLVSAGGQGAARGSESGDDGAAEFTAVDESPDPSEWTEASETEGAWTLDE